MWCSRRLLVSVLSRSMMASLVRSLVIICGTEMVVVQEGIPGVIPPESCQLGWQESLLLLTQLVEAEMPVDARTQPSPHEPEHQPAPGGNREVQQHGSDVDGSLLRIHKDIVPGERSRPECLSALSIYSRVGGLPQGPRAGAQSVARRPRGRATPPRGRSRD